MEENNNMEQNTNNSNVDSSTIGTHINIIKDEALKKREKKKFLITVLISVAVVIIVAITGLLVYRHFKKSNEITFDESYDLYQYFSGIRVDYKGKATITKDGDITKIESKEKIENIEDAPMYFGNNDNEMLTTQNMQIVFPRYKTKSYKLKFFTKITYDKDSKIAYYEKKDKKKVSLQDAFLYNGENLYIVFDNVNFKIDDKEYSLSPLSYIIVNYKDQIELYDKENDKYTMIDTHEKDVVIEIDGYNVNLSTDMYYKDNESVLLVKNVNNLKEYSE